MTRSCAGKLTPKYQPMCKRLIFSGHFYRAVQQPGVELVTDPIDHIEPRGVVTADGTLHELDLLVSRPVSTPAPTCARWR